ncbi:MAG: nicotinamide-nucleotide adenylyltransferase [Candidatus Daviesbacteria bacterium]
MMERVAIFGRFQPLHKGHLTAFEQMDQDEDFQEIIIGIGSSQYHHTLNNPFTFEERAEMIRRSLKTNKLYQIIAIPDINCYSKWVSHVESLTSKFSVVYTGNPVVKKLFEEKNYQIKEVNFSYPINASKIREQIITGGPWQKYLPQGTIEVIKEINGAERIQNLYCQYLKPNVAADVIVNYNGEGIVLIKRRSGKIFGGWWALPGGFLETNKESTQEAAARELGEETSLEINPQDLELFNVYSNPKRDPRHHTVGIVYQAYIKEGNLQAGDDACEIKVFPFNQIPNKLAFDHAIIINDYLTRKVKIYES